MTDCGNGVAGALVPRLFRALGCEVIDLYSTVDGTFPNHHPDPIRPENLTDLIATVQRGKGQNLASHLMVMAIALGSCRQTVVLFGPTVS
ncbi:MAG: hypothetical protein CM1200mP41_15170 [Gammaproteobacteria bacterium]|nr:MAG: hypothetical protein CM1200mP41_15170 [Gammaproteobacteria bacterium]